VTFPSALSFLADAAEWLAIVSVLFGIAVAVAWAGERRRRKMRP
jgi:hypothetical protein